MRFKISDKVFEQFPTYIVGVVVARNVDNVGKSKRIKKLLHQSIDVIKQQFPGIDEISNHPSIKVWRESFAKLGLGPKEFPSSIDAMVTRIVKKGDFPFINKVVNLANSVGLKYLVPLGVHDIDKLKGNIQIRFSEEGDIFTPMGQSETEVVEPGEIVYADDLEVRTRKWVWRQGEKAKIFPDSKTVFFPIDGFQDVNPKDVSKARDDLAGLVEEHLDGTTQKFLVGKDNPMIEF